MSGDAEEDALIERLAAMKLKFAEAGVDIRVPELVTRPVSDQEAAYAAAASSAPVTLFIVPDVPPENFQRELDAFLGAPATRGRRKPLPKRLAAVKSEQQTPVQKAGSTQIASMTIYPITQAPSKTAVHGGKHLASSADGWAFRRPTASVVTEALNQLGVYLALRPTEMLQEQIEEEQQLLAFIARQDVARICDQLSLKDPDVKEKRDFCAEEIKHKIDRGDIRIHSAVAPLPRDEVEW